MKMKKVLAMVMTVTMAAGLFAGCGSSGQGNAGTDQSSQTTAGQTGKEEKQTEVKTSKGEKVHLTLFTGKIETIDVMNEIIEEFNASQDRIEVVQEYQKDASNVIKIKFASDEVPDIMTTYEQGFVDEGKYLNLSEYPELWERLTPAMKEACTDIKTGNQYRICTNMTMAGFFYNKEILDELNLTIPDNWNDFVTVLETIKEQKPEVTPWFIFGSEAWHLGHLIEFIPHGYLKASLGTVEAKKAMLENNKELLRFGEADGPMAVFAEKMLELQEKGLLNADVLTATSDNCVQDFVSGRAAMFSNGMWVISSLLEANPKMEDKIGFAPYPAYMDGAEPVVLSAEDSGYSISATTEHKEEAVEFLQFLFKDENQKKYSEAAKAPSAFTSVSADWAPENIVAEVNSALESAASIGYTNEKPAGFSGDDAGRMLQELFNGQYTPEEYAKAYEETWDSGMSVSE